MRYGRISINKKVMGDLLFITEQHQPAVWRVTDLPDDIEIIGVEFENSSQSFIVTLKGSGAPLVKVPVGAVIPFIEPFVFTTEDPHK